MNLLRILLWVLVIGAAAFSGPNIPAQLLAAAREAINLVARRLGFGRAA